MKKRTYRVPSNEPRVAVTIRISQSHYDAMESFRSLTENPADGDSQAALIEYGLSKIKGLDRLIAENQEYYAKERKRQQEEDNKVASGN